MIATGENSSAFIDKSGCRRDRAGYGREAREKEKKGRLTKKKVRKCQRGGKAGDGKEKKRKTRCGGVKGRQFQRNGRQLAQTLELVQVTVHDHSWASLMPTLMR